MRRILLFATLALALAAAASAQTAGRITGTIKDPDGGTTTFAYDPAGRLQTITRPNGTGTTYTYGPLARPTRSDRA